MDNGSDKKFGENIFSREYNFSTVNPFSGGFNPEKSNAVQSVKEEPKTLPPIKRLNGYDCNILNQTSFSGDDTEELSIDYRIKEKENLLKDLDAKIKVADNYGTQNEALGLKARKQRVMQELDVLRKQQVYGNSGMGDFSKHTKKTHKEKMFVIYKIQDFVSRQILAKLSKKINSVVTLSDSLKQLSEISESVDELVGLNVPYGEKSQNYEKLTAYLNQANIIHSKISKSIGKKYIK